MILLDTHAWVWWVSDPGRIPSRARSAIEKAVTAAALYVSAISVWEVAMLVAKGRLELTMPAVDWVARSEALPFLKFVPIDNPLALRSVQLDGFPHPDPADRMIVATALALDASIVTKDRRIREYSQVESIW